MTIEDGLTIIGIIGLVAGFLLLAGGIVLLVISIIKTAKGKRRIGGIVGGGIMIFGSLMLMITVGSFAFTASMLYSAPYSHNLESIPENIMTALTDKDTVYFSHLFAKESYSGEALAKEDADTIIGHIEGDVKTIRLESVSVTFKNGTYASQEKFTVITEDSEKYVLYIYFIYGSDHEDYVGIQHIKMYDGAKVLEEFGTPPDLD